ncbi:hypothetical protein F4810DRAFT_309390 [Camillea tinctor]|nr:hypothetical protein F4810DRAFT_309390 [Camillea tinctor]
MTLTDPVTNIALSVKGSVKPDGFLHNWIRAKKDPVADNTTRIMVKALQDLLCDVNKKQQGSTDSVNIDPRLECPDNTVPTRKSRDTSNGPGHIEFYFNQDSEHDYIQLDVSLHISTSDASPKGWEAINHHGWVSRPGLILQHVGDPRICCMKPPEVAAPGLDCQPKQTSGSPFTEEPWIQGPQTPMIPSVNSHIERPTTQRGRPTRGRGRGRGAKINGASGGRPRAEVNTRRQIKRETRKRGISAQEQHMVKIEPTVDVSQDYFSPPEFYHRPYLEQMALASQNATLPTIQDPEELEAVNLGFWSVG